MAREWRLNTQGNYVEEFKEEAIFNHHVQATVCGKSTLDGGGEKGHASTLKEVP